jgi:hypothetical protein
MPVVVLAELTGYKVEDIASMEHGDLAVPRDLEDKLNRIEQETTNYILRLIEESKERGYILTVRFNGELSGMVPEYSDFGSMWHRACALEVQGETGLPIRYMPKKAKVRIA